MKTPFEEELQHLINRKSRECGSNTPDFILARYMLACLEAFEEATQRREQWYGRADQPFDAFDHVIEEVSL